MEIHTHWGRKARIVPRKNGVYYLWYYDKDGHRIAKSLETKDQESAKRKAIEYIAPCGPLLLEVLEAWLFHNKTKSLAYRHDVKRFWIPFAEYLNNKPIKKLTRQDILNYKAYLEGRVKRSGKGKGKSQLSATHIGIQFRTLKAVWNWAVKMEFINPSQDVFKYIEIPKTNNRTEFLSSGEINQLLNSISNKLHKAYIEFMLATGCRVGEIYNLKWEDINDTFILFRGKTGKRPFPLLPKVRDIISQLRELQDGLFDEDFVLLTNNGRHFATVVNWSKTVKRCIERAGLRNSYTAHTLRHTFASHLVMQGVPIYTVAKLLGHTLVKTTERYAHLAPERVNLDISFF